MAIFGSSRDAKFMRSVNREVISKVMDLTVLYYRIDFSNTSINIYEESEHKTYLQPVLVHCISKIDPKAWDSTDFSSDVSQVGRFAFFKDDLLDKDIVPKQGDIIELRERFFEIDAVTEDYPFAGKDPDNWFGGDSHGYMIGYVCDAHLTRQSKLDILPVRKGGANDSNDYRLPNLLD